MASTQSSISIDDGNPNITYAPRDQWTVHTNVKSSFQLFNNTDTFSSLQNATATLIFYGNAIEYWGNQGPYHGPCAIRLDGQSMTTVNSHAPADDVPILLYSTNNLTVGDHSLEIRVVDASYPNVCEVDRFVVNITSPIISSSVNPNIASTVTSTNGFVAQSTDLGRESTAGSVPVAHPTNDTSQTTKRKSVIPLAAIVGAAVGGAIVLVVLMILSIFRRSRERKAQRHANTISKPFIINEGPSSPVPQTPRFYQASDENRTSCTASPIEQPFSTYHPAGRFPEKLVTHPRPGAFNAPSSSGYPQNPQSPISFNCSSPISEEPPASAAATISPTSAKFEEPQSSGTPRVKRVYGIYNRATSSIGSDRYSDSLVVVRNDLPPPAYDG